MECSLQSFSDTWPPKAGNTLVVGSKCYNGKPDRRELYADATGIDLEEGEGVDFVHDLETPLVGQKYDHVDCVSVLEHVRRPWLMAANIEDVLRRNGTLLISVPFVWRVHAYPSDFWRMTAEALVVLFPRIEWFSRKYLVEGKLCDVVKGRTDEHGKWMARAELIAAGRKCG